jgi:hypothetical protein
VSPVLITAGVVGVSLVAPVPIALTVVLGVVGLVALSWTPIRLRGLSVELHAHGIVASWRGDRWEVAFEDVDEVWFELARVTNQPGARLQALRLVTFGGAVHRVPLAVEGAIALAGAVLQACSGPLLGEARQALGEGVTLRFGKIEIDRKGIADRKRRLAWSEVRLAVVQQGKVLLYRGWPIIPSLTVRLDGVPNPTVLTGLLTACAPNVRVDDAIVIPFATAAEQARALEAMGSEGGLRMMLVGGVWIVIGIALTMSAYSPRSNTHWVLLGPTIYGLVCFFRGLRAYRR